MAPGIIPKGPATEKPAIPPVTAPEAPPINLPAVLASSIPRPSIPRAPDIFFL